MEVRYNHVHNCIDPYEYNYNTNLTSIMLTGTAYIAGDNYNDLHGSLRLMLICTLSSNSMPAYFTSAPNSGEHFSKNKDYKILGDHLWQGWTISGSHNWSVTTIHNGNKDCCRCPWGNCNIVVYLLANPHRHNTLMLYIITMILNYDFSNSF